MPTAAWQGWTELSAGEMAGLCYVPALAGARPRAVWGLVSQACTLPLKTETSLLCLSLCQQCAEQHCVGAKFGY